MRLWILAPLILLFLLLACATSVSAQQLTPPTDTPENCCRTYSNLLKHLDLRMSGTVEPW